ncbi:hypothetical protein [Streptomyces sp. NPDC026659]|uniref:hypothetical protein n=1 Tax=Streptomyces sp. NPDC026659 TaxID=3155123 RepID=UPI00340166D4
MELAYRPVLGDFLAAAWRRKRVWWLVFLGAAQWAYVAQEVWSLRTGHSGDPVPWLALRAVIGTLLLAAPLVTAWFDWRGADRDGTIRVTLTETGVTVAAGERVRTFSWATRPRCRETRRVFLLTGGKPPSPRLTVLPKRALTPSDTERLRALLERHAGLGRAS